MIHGCSAPQCRSDRERIEFKKMKEKKSGKERKRKEGKDKKETSKTLHYGLEQTRIET